VERWWGTLPVWEALGRYHEEFSVSVWLVPSRGQRRVQKWFARPGGGGYPDLGKLPGALRLDSVKGLKLREMAAKWSSRP
jgi:hypothetical protein